MSVMTLWCNTCRSPLRIDYTLTREPEGTFCEINKIAYEDGENQCCEAYVAERAESEIVMRHNEEERENRADERRRKW